MREDLLLTLVFAWEEAGKYAVDRKLIDRNVKQ